MQSSDVAPRVSVIICAYNGAGFLTATIRTVLAQTFTDWELVVIDDGSTDSSAEIVRTFLDPRICLVQQENLGAARALTAALALSRGEFVAFLDQDDLWTCDKLRVHVERMALRPELALTFSWFQYINDEGDKIGLESRRFRGGIDFRGLMKDFVIGATSNVVARREAICRAGGVDERFPRMYDLDLFLRVALGSFCQIEAIPLDLMYYRRHRKQITRDFRVLEDEWEQVVAKMRTLSPETASVEGQARCNASRWLARLAYEQHNYRQATRYVLRAYRNAPLTFLLDVRNWVTAAACLSGLLLPRSVHLSLERFAGLRRE